MKSLRSLTVACLFFLLLAFSTAAQTNKINAAEAKDHVGEIRTVCGKVVSTHYASGSKGATHVLKPRRALSEGSFHDLNLGQRSREIRNARNEISGCEGVRDGENHEPSREARDNSH
jgi:hypothetical protein